MKVDLIFPATTNCSLFPEKQTQFSAEPCKPYTRQCSQKENAINFFSNLIFRVLAGILFKLERAAVLSPAGRGAKPCEESPCTFNMKNGRTVLIQKSVLSIFLVPIEIESPCRISSMSRHLLVIPIPSCREGAALGITMP